ncbi:MAG: homoserine O-acetyltransferase MetX [Planctomycetota bacterium]
MSEQKTTGEDTFFDSSDSLRQASILPDAQVVTFEQPLELERGERLSEVTVAYETYGELNEAGDNAVLICHALSGDSHVARHDADDDPGWWEIAVGPGKAIDTDKYFVICPNVLGGCRGTTGPNSVNPETHRPYAQDFPTITTGDMVEVQRRLIDHLGIDKLLAVVGASMGGHQVLLWGTTLPHRTRGVVPIATSPRLTTLALSFDVIGRNAILRDPNFRGGQYYDGGPAPDVGLALARMLGHITYLSPESMKEKFEHDRHRPRDIQTEFEKKFSVGSYLAYQGERFVERFDANSYIALSMAMDLFDLGATPEALADTFSQSTCNWLLVSFTSDWLFPPEQSQQMLNALIASDRPVSYCNVTSHCGHDAFLLPNELDVYGELLRAFLANLSGNAIHNGRPAPRATGEDPSSIFHAARLDYERILELISPDSSVLDLGCGDGTLLWHLKQRGHRTVMGLERDEEAIVACVRRGLETVMADLNRGLRNFADKQFDYVVLSRTLQQVMDVEGLLEEMVRVGRRCVVGFPNFGYYKLRQMLAEQGRAPESAGVLRFHWYDTPNIRFFTIADFEDLCRQKGFKVHQTIGLDTEQGREVTENPNLNADVAVAVISG